MSHNSQLNIIYFVDANKTRSLKVPLRSALILLFFFIIVLLWSLGSLLVLNLQAKTTHEDGKRITALLDIIFDYQCRYDHAFDRAYPQIQNQEKTEIIAAREPNKLPVETSAAIIAKEEEEVTTPSMEEPKKSQEEPKKEHVTPVQESLTKVGGGEPASAESISTPAAQDFNIAVETLKVNLLAQKLQIRFAMRNTDSPKQNEGYVLGVGRFVTDEGTTIYVPTPSDIPIDPASGKPTSMRLGYRFNIKYYKKRTMEFPVPPGKIGHFVGANIFTSHGYVPQGSFDVKVPTDKAETPEITTKDQTDLAPEPAQAEGEDR